MVTLTDDAQRHLDRYLMQVKAALRGHPSVDVGEIERDIRGHIDAELAGQPEPAGARSLREVLDRLGAPDTWVPDEDLPAWRRVLNRLRSGPEDWRLAYLTFALFFGGPLLGPLLGPVGPALMLASFPMARASLAVLAEHDEPVGARRWLIYPPLVVWYSAFALVLFVWPLPLIGSAMTDNPAVREQVVQLVPRPLWAVAPSLAALALGSWWVLLGSLLSRFVGAVRVAFWPFAEWFDRRHALRLTLAGLGVIAASGTVLIAILKWG